MDRHQKYEFLSFLSVIFNENRPSIRGNFSKCDYFVVTLAMVGGELSYKTPMHYVGQSFHIQQIMRRED